MFEEIKKSCRNKKSDLTSVIDDVHGAQNISNHFKEIYEKLYNEQGVLDDDLIADIDDDITDNLQESKYTVNLLSADIVKAAIKKLKADKSDVSGDFTSDCLKAAPDSFHFQLASLFCA